MAAKNAARPRPSKNSNGQPAAAPQPSYTHTINVEPAPAPKPAPVMSPPPPPGPPGGGQTNPMTHPAHPLMSNLGAQPPQLHQSQAMPMGGGSNPTGNPLGNLTPEPTMDQRQVREQIQFKDMSPPEQAQVAQQQGLDPYAPLRMVQQETQNAVTGGASTGPVPNALTGPFVPPGIESFPDDFAHLTRLMAQGYAPGASPQEHEFAQNADALARAKVKGAFDAAQNGTGDSYQAQPYAPAPPGGGGPQSVSLNSAIPSIQSPTLSSGLGAPATPPPPAPGGGTAPPIPPALIAALLARAKQRR